MLNNNTCNHFTVGKQMINIESNDSCYMEILKTIQKGLKNELWLIWKCYQQNLFKNHIYLIYMFKEDLALNNPQ